MLNNKIEFFKKQKPHKCEDQIKKAWLFTCISRIIFQPELLNIKNLLSENLIFSEQVEKNKCS